MQSLFSKFTFYCLHISQIIVPVCKIIDMLKQLFNISIKVSYISNLHNKYFLTKFLKKNGIHKQNPMTLLVKIVRIQYKKKIVINIVFFMLQTKWMVLLIQMKHFLPTRRRHLVIKTSYLPCLFQIQVTPLTGISTQVGIHNDILIIYNFFCIQ